jgi:CRP-like cAMP-binding protein
VSQLALSNTYKVWAADDLVYGPIELSTLIQWVQEKRVLADTWLHSHKDRAWRQAGDVEQLRPHFSVAQEDTAFRLREEAEGTHVAADELRQFGIFASLSNEQLEEFAGFGEICRYRPGEIILKKGDPGDALYLILKGEVRARLMVAGQDQTLARIPAGEFFGEMAMFARSLRSADVVAEERTRLLRVSSETFLVLSKENPELAAPVFFALAGTMATRIAAVNKKVEREVAAEFAWR